MKKSDVAARALMHDVLDGAASPADRARFDRLCAEKPDLAEEYALLRSVRATTLGLGLARPPADLRARIAAAVDAAAREDAGGPAAASAPAVPARFSGARRFAPFSIAAAALLAVGLFLFEGGTYDVGRPAPGRPTAAPGAIHVVAEAVDASAAAKSTEPAGPEGAADKATWTSGFADATTAGLPATDSLRLLRVVNDLQERVARGQESPFFHTAFALRGAAAEDDPPVAWSAQTFAYAVDVDFVDAYRDTLRTLTRTSVALPTIDAAPPAPVTTGGLPGPGSTALGFAIDDLRASVDYLAQAGERGRPGAPSAAPPAAPAPEALAAEEKRRADVDGEEASKSSEAAESEAGRKLKDMAKADRARAPAEKPVAPTTPGAGGTRGQPAGGAVPGGTVAGGGGGGGSGPGRPSGGGRGGSRGVTPPAGGKAGAAAKKSGETADRGGAAEDEGRRKAKNGAEGALDRSFGAREAAPAATGGATPVDAESGAGASPAVRFVSGPGAFAAVERSLVRRGATVRELPVLRADPATADARKDDLERLVRPEAVGDRVARTRFLEVELGDADFAALLAELAAVPGLSTLDPTGASATASRSRRAVETQSEEAEKAQDRSAAAAAASRAARRPLRLVVVER